MQCFKLGVSENKYIGWQFQSNSTDSTLALGQTTQWMHKALMLQKNL